MLGIRGHGWRARHEAERVNSAKQLLAAMNRMLEDPDAEVNMQNSGLVFALARSLPAKVNPSGFFAVREDLIYGFLAGDFKVADLPRPDLSAEAITDFRTLSTTLAGEAFGPDFGQAIDKPTKNMAQLSRLCINRSSAQDPQTSF